VTAEKEKTSRSERTQVARQRALTTLSDLQDQAELVLWKGPAGDAEFLQVGVRGKNS
jgi:hypothetical protein